VSDLIVLSFPADEATELDVRGAVAAVAAAGGVWCGIDEGRALARFEPDDPPTALAGALQALDAFDAAGELRGASRARARAALCFGDAIVVAASGEVDDVGPGVVIGETVDRARDLSARARSGEVLLDTAIRDRLEGEVIVARTVRGGGARSYGLDRRVALRAQALDLARGLCAPPDVGLENILEEARLLLRDVPSAIRISAPPGSGGTGLADAIVASFPNTVLLDAGVGSSEPLGAVSAAIRSRLGGAAVGDYAASRVAAEARVLARKLPAAAAEALRRATPVVADLAAGRLRPVPAVVEALAAHAAALHAAGLTPLVRAEIDLLDPESLEVVRRLHEARAPLRLVLIGETDVEIPRAPVVEPPEWSDGRARSLAASMLAVSTRTAWLDRVVARGARCPRGTLDAVRDAVEEGAMMPGGGLAPRPLKAPPRRPTLERVLQRRVARLPETERAVLFAVAILGDRSGPAVLEFVCVGIGLGRDDVEAALGALDARGFISRGQGRPRVVGRRTRSIIRSEVPAELRTRLHRTCAAALGVLFPGARTFAVLSHLAKAGDRKVVAERTLEAAQEALDSGLPLAALRGLDFDPAPGAAEDRFRYAEIRERVAAQLGDGEGRMVALAELQSIAKAADEPAWLARVAARNAEAALAGREVREAERWAQIAVAAGGSRSLSDRLEALADLTQGDPDQAAALFHRAAERDTAAGRGHSAVRGRLGEAVAMLRRGDVRAATRGALGVLAEARRRRDRRSEWFGLWVLAEACSRAGLADVAARLAQAAGPSPG